MLYHFPVFFRSKKLNFKQRIKPRIIHPMKKRIVLCLAMAGIFPAVQAQTVVIDSQVTLAEALAGSSAPQEVLDSLAIADVEYYSFDGKLHRGQIVMHKTLKEDVIHLFRFMRNQRFPIESAIPIRFDKPNDGTSMDTLNNSYSFHYRRISTSGNGSRSVHSYGMANDINPYNNPAVLANGKVHPPGRNLRSRHPGHPSRHIARRKRIYSAGVDMGRQLDFAQGLHALRKETTVSYRCISKPIIQLLQKYCAGRCSQDI